MVKNQTDTDTGDTTEDQNDRKKNLKQRLARISHQFSRCQVQSFWQYITVICMYCQNTEEDGSEWTDLW